MMTCNRAVILAVLALSVSTISQTLLAAQFTVGTRDELDLDLDGAGTETPGDLGVTSAPISVFGGALPTEFTLAGVTDFTLLFTATNGNLSADQGFLVESVGIGVARDGETDSSKSSLSTDGGEALSVALTSNGAPLWITGVDISSWRNQFPVSQVTFVGATVGGSDTVTGSNTLTNFGLIEFDSPVTSVTILNTSSGDDVRLRAVLISEVPEPTSWVLLLSAVAILGCYRRISSRRMA